MMKFPYTALRDPGNGIIPFHIQGNPIPDPLQKHTGQAQRDVAAKPYNKSNDLVFGRFLGTVWPQQNQPHFLSANERVVFEDAW